MKRFIALMALALALVALARVANAETEEWAFSDVTEIRVDGVSGDIVVEPARDGQGRIALFSDVRPKDRFHPSVEQDGSRLYIEEDWGRGNSNGQVEWTIYLPETDTPVELRIETASGDLRCQDVALQVDFDTASGDVELTDVVLGRKSKFDTASGDFELSSMTVTESSRFSTASGDFRLQDLTLEEGCKFSTASGDVESRRCQGFFDLSTASGDVDVRDSAIEGFGEFSTASGDVSVQLDRLPPKGLTASSASGDVELDVEDFGDDFTLILVKREDKGRISCPFEFTSERTFRDHHVYEEKIVKRGSGGPEIELNTASGRVTVRN